MSGWMDEWVDGWMNGWMDDWMDGQINARIFANQIIGSQQQQQFLTLCEDVFITKPGLQSFKHK